MCTGKFLLKIWLHKIETDISTTYVVKREHQIEGWYCRCKYISKPVMEQWYHYPYALCERIASNRWELLIIFVIMILFGNFNILETKTIDLKGKTSIWGVQCHRFGRKGNYLSCSWAHPNMKEYLTLMK